MGQELGGCVGWFTRLLVGDYKPPAPPGPRLYPIQDGELTAVQLALRCGWLTTSGKPHNLAVILAAVNARYDEKGLLVQRADVQPAHLRREIGVHAFTRNGVARFLIELDRPREPGASFRVEPNEHALDTGRKNACNVQKSAAGRG